MKVIVTGSLGNISKPLTKILVAAGHEVTVITSKSDKKQAIESLGAKAAIGSVSDASFLTATFSGADAVYSMIPPNLGGANVIANAKAAGQAYAQAFQNAGVKRVVQLSSIGADYPSGTGPITGIHEVEQVYSHLKGISITLLRAGFFYTNFYNDVPLIKGMSIMGSNYPGNIVAPLVHAEDIAAAAAEELQKTSAVSGIRYIVSDLRKPEEAAKVLGAAIGQPNLPWVQFPDEQALQGMLQAGIPAEIAGLYVEMGKGFREGKLTDDLIKQGSPVTGKKKLEDFATEFAAKF